MDGARPHVIFTDATELKDRVTALTGRRIYGQPVVTEDMSQYMSIVGGMVLRLAGDDYFVLADAKEGRFGIEEQPKFWVKYAMDLTRGERKVIKLVFHEEMATRHGEFRVRCTRSPLKESRILELVRGNPNFMQGRTVTDIHGGMVRIIDRIEGESLFNWLGMLAEDHEHYFHHTLPATLASLCVSIESLKFLADHGQHHGDVRNDHILIEEGTGRYRWIDFDFSVNFPDLDLWSIGNLLTYVVGKGMHPFRQVMREGHRYRHGRTTLSLEPDDALMLSKHRIANLRKLFPYIPERLNRILLRFSVGARTFYDDYDSVLSDIREAMAEMQ